MKDKLPKKLRKAKSLEEVYQLLLRYPTIGTFVAYQLAIDLNYSPVVNFSENDFVQPGPGALRGIKKCFESTGNRSPVEVIKWMQAHQEQEFELRGLKPVTLFGRPLQLIDCQGLFCETDKYCRVAFPDMVSRRSKIKQGYEATGRRLPKPFYPPKWELKI